ncbi:MAG: S-adenosylmethionine:tRNA ribosyltransferase-isomerase [Ilumatobacteraceae bacterium]
MRTEDFDYDLPAELIAQEPIEPRDSARLLVDRGPGASPDHRHVRDLGRAPRTRRSARGQRFPRALPARLTLQRPTGGAAEVLLLESLDGRSLGGVGAARPKAPAGERLVLPDRTPLIEIGERTAAGDTFVVHVLDHAAADAHGAMPLPPYITTPLQRPERYQTVYARERARRRRRPRGCTSPRSSSNGSMPPGSSSRVELMVGLDTFKPISTDDPADHVIHTERYRVPPETMEACRTASRVVAVGTTAVRALETAAATGQLGGRSDLFIRRPYDWRIVDAMITNFHLPRTTLLCMIDAFVGPRWRALYESAIAERYRMLSFGDAMLLTRTEPR